MSILSERKIRRTITALMVALLAIVVVLSAHGMPAYAEGDIPETGVSYTLTYPDGTVVKEKDGKPLTYNDVKEALKEDSWKLLSSNQKSDADGIINLPATWKAEGVIKIIETKVPAGYKQGAISEKVVDLKEKSATFVNPKEKAETVTTTTPGSPNTGDGNNVTLYIIIGSVAAAILAFFLFKRRKVRAGIISMMLIGVFAIGTVYAADGFVINKIDDNGDPVEGAVFDIYGKPEVTWETTESVSINVGLSYRIFSGAHWNDIVATSQTVTVSGGSMTDKKLLFTPGTAAQSVELPGAGTYTISMEAIGQSDIKPESELQTIADDYMPVFIDTVSTTVVVDASGNCTVSNTTGNSFVVGYNSNSYEFIYNDIDALMEAYLDTGADDKLNTLNPHSTFAGASASGKDVTLTTVISQGWDDYTDITVK